MNLQQQRSPPARGKISIEYEMVKDLSIKLKTPSPQMPAEVETTPPSVSKYTIKKGRRGTKHEYKIKFDRNQEKQLEEK